VKRAGKTGSGERAATGDAGWRAGAWYEQTHKQECLALECLSKISTLGSEKTKISDRYWV
jgi:hypothetical protein